MTRALAAGIAGILLAACAGCSPDAVPTTVTVRADSTAAAVVRSVAAGLDRPGLSVRVAFADSAWDAAADPADVVVSADAGRLGGLGPPVALARSGLVLVGPPGAVPAPTLAAALAAARSVGVAERDASGRAARTALDAAGLWTGLPVVRFATTQAALDSVAARATDLAFALAADALTSTPYAVVYRFPDADAPPAVVSGAVRAGAPPQAQAVLDALAAPTAYRAWAAAGFRPPPR